MGTPVLRLPPAPFDVVGLGVNVINHLYLLPRFPEADSKVDAVAVAEQGGGVVATALVACARLGLRTKYLGKVGRDRAGQASTASLATEGVDVSDVVTDPAEHTRVTVGLIEQGSGRRTLIRGMPPLARLRSSEVPAQAVTTGRILHLDGYEGEAALWAARLAQEAGIPVSLDAENASERLDRLLPLVTVLIVSQDFAQQFVGSGSDARLLDGLSRFGPTIVGVTCGAEGASVRWQDETVRVPGLKVEVVDTTGAGDVFHGAFLAGLIWGWPLDATLRLANATAALKCQHLGGRAGIPALKDVRVALRQRGEELPATGATLDA
jgi:sugar/nucleoside kinase (ribokinase family)